LEAERDRRARQQALVAELGQRALAGVPLQQVMDEAVDIVGRTLDAAPVGIAELLPGGELLLLRAGVGWNDAVGSATGPAGADSLVGYTAASGEPVVSEDLAADSRFRISAFLAGQTAASAAAVAIAGAAEPFGVLAAFCRERRAFSADDVTFLHGVANVISSAVERVASEQRILEVRDAERRRIARDLHDEALQDLTDALLVVTAGGDTTDPAAVPRLVPALNRVGQQLRGAIYDLRLGGEEDRPFGELLRHLVDLQREMSSGYEIELQISTAAPVGPLGKTGTEVLRVVREALVNARRHSGARHVRVRASGSRSELRVEVEDDGRGFDMTAKGKSGITGMRERAALHGSELEIRAAPGRGTLVGLTVPVDGADGQAASQVRVLLVEDHAAVRQAIAATFAREPHFAVTGQAASMAEARRMLRDVDVAVIDLGLPDGYGGDLIKELQAVNPQAQALVLSASLDRADLARAVESGAAGTLDKTARLDEVVDAVRRLQTGESLLPVDEVVELLRFAGRRREDERDDRQAVDRLTAREHEVLQALADGLDSQAIADRLHITIRTERNHIANILGKLGVHSQLQALVFALRYDLVEIR
jgi:DNA-binding NarL/FixJ family response regulator/signal transduction histidine kinase